MYIIGLLLIVGIYMLVWDCNILKKKKLNKEYNIAKFLGISYIAMSAAYYIYYVNRR
ncbi:CLC_0170 family protein [Tepidibacter mesophilus]|uniref:CLC_0170 family protein n=1 Tax=Tepidibacter mesophilus TaxID=655607 RepID=UPI001650FEEE|nr:CLC_0170 family protein [Tepidibacter mesophilus]